MLRARPRPTARHAAPRRSGKVAGLAVAAATATAVAVAGGVAITGGGPVRDTEPERLAAAVSTVDLAGLSPAREPRVSRSGKRVLLRPQPVDHEFATARLNVWTKPQEHGRLLGQLPWGSRVAVTGQVVGHWAEVLGKKNQVRWVNAAYLSEKKPRREVPPTSDEPESTGTTDSTGSTSSTGISGAACPDGSSIESGLTSSAIRLYRGVCAAFPALTTYGGYDAHGEHSTGQAIDFMVTDSSLGQAVANWVQANAGSLGIYDVIWAQHIWTPERAGEGWRFMSDRGSATANHYDHVHVAVY